jgi:hypothetical protein
MLVGGLAVGSEIPCVEQGAKYGDDEDDVSEGVLEGFVFKTSSDKEWFMLVEPVSFLFEREFSFGTSSFFKTFSI